MFGAPVQPNAVHVRMIPTGCCKSEFDSTYPIHLNGIISQYEYQESINNINKTISSRISLLICTLIFIICLFGGMALFIAGGITAAKSRTYGFPVLVGVGVGVFVLGMFVMFFGMCIIQTRRTTRMRQAIAKESMKYSMRSPTPCSWRLNASRVWGGYGRNRNVRIIYSLTIEIGHAVAPGSGNAPYQYNQVAPQPTSFFSQQNNIAPSAPYYNQSATNYCSQCGAPHENLGAKFCPSCGQPYNRY